MTEHQAELPVLYSSFPLVVYFACGSIYVGSPPGSPVPGILQARTLEWVAIAFSNAWKWKVKGKSLSRVRLLATPWTTAHQAPLSMGCSRQEYWSGVPLPSLEYICQSYSLSSSHLFLHHVYKSVFYVCVSILLIYCPANKVISTISLDSAYIR